MKCLLALPLAAALASCGYNPGYRSTAPPNDFSTTTTSGAVLRPDLTGDSSRREEAAESEQRLQREVAERQRRASGAAEPEAAEDAQAGTATPEERAAFAEELRIAIASLDTGVDTLRQRAAHAESERAARASEPLRQLAERRAQLEQVKKRLDSAADNVWRHTRDEAAALVDDAMILLDRVRRALL